MTEADTVAGCPPDPILELYLAGELPFGSLSRVHVSSCPRCAARLEQMKRDGDAYLESESARAVAQRLRRLEPRKAGRRLAFAGWGAILPLAAAAMWLLLFRTPVTPDLHAKGAGAVSLVVDHGGAVAPWNGRPLSPGDILQLSWTRADAAFVAVIGREDREAPVRWFPEKAALAERLPAGTRSFGDGMRFDPPFHGAVYVFISDRPFATDALEAALREGREPEFVGGKAIRLDIPGPP
jgi:hypothetical protein